MRILTFLLFITVSTSLHCQESRDYSLLFDSTFKSETQGISYELPVIWKELQMERPPHLFYYDLTWKGIPGFFNGGPILTYFYINKNKANSLEQALKEHLASKPKLPSRKKTENFKDTVLSINADDRQCTVETRFYHEKERLYVTCYTRLIFSEEDNSYFSISLQVEHRDFKFEYFESEFKFDKLAWLIFDRVLLKK